MRCRSLSSAPLGAMYQLTRSAPRTLPPLRSAASFRKIASAAWLRAASLFIAERSRSGE
jgi:hypothetical protein